MDYDSFRNQGLISFEEITPQRAKSSWSISDIKPALKAKKTSKEAADQSWEKLNRLSPTIVESLNLCGFNHPTDIQKSVILEENYAKSINFVIAPTGSGKTIGFLTPLLNDAYDSEDIDSLKYIIVTPTKDLAFQIKDVSLKIVNHLAINLKIAALTGGMFSEKQKRLLKTGVNLLITTPGRLKELVELNIDFSNVRVAIFDEADRCLDSAQTSFRDINVSMRKIVNLIKEKSHLTITFVSASLDPAKIQSNSFIAMKPLCSKNTNIITSNVKSSYSILDYSYHVLEEDKPALLFSLLEQQIYQKVLVFVKTISEMAKLKKLGEYFQEKIIKVDSRSRMGKRNKAVEKAFKSGQCIIFSTDLMGRGIDFKGFDCIIQYSLPDNLNQFIHRRGRTGRNCSGTNILFTTPKDQLCVEKLVCRNFPLVRMDLNLDCIEKMQEKINWFEKHKMSNNAKLDLYSPELEKFAEELGQDID